MQFRLYSCSISVDQQVRKVLIISDSGYPHGKLEVRSFWNYRGDTLVTGKVTKQQRQTTNKNNKQTNKQTNNKKLKQKRSHSGRNCMLFFKSSYWLCINIKKLNSELSLCVDYKMDICSLSLTPPPPPPILCISVRKQSWLNCFEIHYVCVSDTVLTVTFMLYTTTANSTAYTQLYKRY